MKTAICYYSRHHENTRKVLEAMRAEGEIDLIDVTAHQTVCLEEYDCIGFASGIYFGKFHESPAWCEIKTLEGTMKASAGDYIIRGVNGEIYPCKPDIFEKTYEPAE